MKSNSSIGWVFDTLREFKEAVSAHTKALLIVSLIVALWAFVFHQAIISAAKVWWVSEIYSHGFFILPITGYLIWRKRQQLAVQSPQPGLWAIPPLLVFSLLYIVGIAGDISLFQHAAIFSILPLTVWLIFGSAIAKTILFPLIFILFSIPFGEEFIPLLQKITADISVWMLKMIGIPLFRNGLYIEIPNGRFVVAEACSGVRFFVGSAVFGAIYAYISYSNKRRQFTFFTIALIVPVIANSIRVSAIILIGYFSDMKYATGTDHLVYGWVFFAIVIILLVIIGNIWADKSGPSEAILEKTTSQLNWSHKRMILIAGFCLVVYTGIYAWAGYINNTKHEFIDLAAQAQGVLQVVQDENWTPKFEDATESSYQIYKLGNNQNVDYFNAYYQFNTPGTELISSTNRIYDPDDWTLKNTYTENITVGHESINALLYSVAGGNREYRLILYWYEVGNLKTYNKLWIKLFQSFDALLGKAGSGRIIIFSTTYRDEELEIIKEKLIDLVRDILNQKTT